MDSERWPGQHLIGTQTDPESDLQNKYRAVLLSPLGRDVLGDLLEMCHFGCTLNPDNAAQIAEYNVGITILNRCGILANGTMNQVVLALSAVTPEK